MKRAENCVHAKINHISFNDDALLCSFAKTKGNQTGGKFDPWHVYANPDAPWICPHLEFARYICCYPDVSVPMHRCLKAAISTSGILRDYLMCWRKWS
jgi:hypothetical protein